MTFYLKYRPQTLDELDLTSVRQSLQKIFDSGHIPHALLFSGPKGTGKTSAARIFAKMMNCENPKKGGSPCNECDQCVSISKSSNIDVFELDAASHRGIEDIRAIRDAVKLAPAKAKKKIYIIDEAHMLTTEASNALLKTLEEPPEHVIFILATTNPEKLIETIRSRVTIIAFKKATVGEIVSSLEKIAKGEKIKSGKDVLEVIAKSSDGSFRDASKIFEQISSEISDLTKDNVEQSLTIQKVFDIDSFLNILKSYDTKSALNFVEDSIEKGAGAREIAEKILQRLRVLLLAKVGVGEEKSDFSKEELIYLIKHFSDSMAKIPLSLIEQLPIEISIIEWCEGRNQVPGIRNQGEKQKIDSSNINPEKENNSKSSQADKKTDSEESGSRVETKKNAVADGNGDIHTNGIMNGGTRVEITDEVWGKVLARMKPDHTSTEALLRAAKPLEFDGSNLVIGVFYKFHKERLEGAPHRDILENALLSEIGSKIRVICTLSEQQIERGSSFVSDAQEHRQNGGEVVLTEPPENNFGVSAALTNDGEEDIIKIAEKIFGN